MSWVLIIIAFAGAYGGVNIDTTLRFPSEMHCNAARMSVDATFADPGGFGRRARAVCVYQGKE